MSELHQKDLQLDRAAAAAQLGISPDSVSRYLADPTRDFPPPDGHIGRSPWWWESTITRYQAAAAERAARRTGRPRSA